MHPPVSQLSHSRVQKSLKLQKDPPAPTIKHGKILLELFGLFLKFCLTHPLFQEFG